MTIDMTDYAHTCSAFSFLVLHPKQNSILNPKSKFRLEADFLHFSFIPWNIKWRPRAAGYMDSI